MKELTISLDPQSVIPLYEQIYQYVKEDIQSGRLACGVKLPSSRSLARYLEISRSTVELAYEQYSLRDILRQSLEKAYLSHRLMEYISSEGKSNREQSARKSREKSIAMIFHRAESI